MKNLLVLIVLTIAIQVSAANRLKIIEVNINNVFVITQGFDDNDNAQVVLSGSLPNICYSALSPEIKIDSRRKRISITQKATLNSLSLCANDANQLPDHLNHPVSFSHEISLGQLVAGTYTVIYNSSPNSQQIKNFVVAKASVGNIDNSLYAHVTSAFIPEMIRPTTNAQLVLTGIINSSCMNLTSDNIKVDRQNNVIIVQPVLELNQNSACNYSPYPLYQIVSLGALTKGTYLIHVRSMSGKSVNRTLTVIGSADINGF